MKAQPTSIKVSSILYKTIILNTLQEAKTYSIDHTWRGLKECFQKMYTSNLQVITPTHENKIGWRGVYNPLTFVAFKEKRDNFEDAIGNE